MRRILAFLVGLAISVVFVPRLTLAQEATCTRTFGGSADDYAHCVQQTSDGGYILVCETDSYGAGGYDVWLIKTDADGVKQWDRTFGGSADDLAYSVQQTSDGGYILAGYTDSYGAGGYDAWLIKTDADGVKQWDRTFGGADKDVARCVQQTSDGGYILLCETVSYAAYGQDVWLIKTDADGVKQWDRTFDVSYRDEPTCVQQTSDGGYIVTASRDYSGSPTYDAWLIKTDAEGVKEWDRTFGDAGPNWDLGRSVQQTSDGGYIFVCETESYGAGGSDVWLIKTDAGGGKQWERTFGGSDNDGIEWPRSLQQTSDGGYILAGRTASYGAGGSDVWLIKTDVEGVKEWDRTFGGSDQDNAYSVQQTSDGGYIIAGLTRSYGAGEMDVWLIKVEGDLLLEPDLTLDSKDFEFCQEATDTLRIQAWISNTGNITATDVQVQFFDNDVPIGADTIRVPVGEKQNVARVKWKLPGRKVENHRLLVKIVSSNPPEQDTSNNEVSRTISVYYVDSGRPDDPFRVTEDGYEFENWEIPPEKAKQYIRDWYESNSLPDKLVRVLVFSDPTRFLAINGLCYGMSATSILYRDNPELKPVNKETFAMTKEDPGVVEKILAYHAAQMAHHLGNLLLQAHGVYSASKEYSKAFDFIANQNMPVLFAAYLNEQHAVAGYEILDLGDEKRVYVYDNNSPGATHYYVQYDLAHNQVKFDDEYGMVFSHYPLTPLLEADAIRKLKEIISDLWTDFIQSLKEKGKHLFFLGSPAYLTITDSFGRRAGFVDGEMVNEIPDASIEEFGGAQAVYVPNDLTYHIETTGAGTGSITLDIIATGIGEEAKQISYEDIPILPDSKTWIDFDPASPDFTMSVDKDGDGIAEQTRPPDSIVRTDQILVTTPPTGGVLKSENIYTYPNPFNPDKEFATLRFSLSKSAKVTVKLYDAAGRLVTTLTEDEYMEAGEEQSLPWDGKNDKGDIVANGVYFCVITTDQGERAVDKVAVLR